MGLAITTIQIFDNLVRWIGTIWWYYIGIMPADCQRRWWGTHFFFWWRFFAMGEFHWPLNVFKVLWHSLVSYFSLSLSPFLLFFLEISPFLSLLPTSHGFFLFPDTGWNFNWIFNGKMPINDKSRQSDNIATMGTRACTKYSIAQWQKDHRWNLRDVSIERMHFTNKAAYAIDSKFWETR